jgi:hypothetical protein
MVAMMRVVDERHDRYSVAEPLTRSQMAFPVLPLGRVQAAERPDSQAVVPAAVSGRIRK